MFRPMIPLANGVAILDGHTRLTRLQTDVPLLLATLSAAVGRCISFILVHNQPQRETGSEVSTT